MRNHMYKIFILALLLAAVPMAGQAKMGWKIYKPGLVKSAIARGETVVLGYLSSW